jgi:hypothetical protein
MDLGKRYAKEVKRLAACLRTKGKKEPLAEW